MGRASKGTVSVESFKNRLRLRWTRAGKRYCLSLGREDTALNRRLAQSVALQIELDLLSGNFDPTLAKYKPDLAASGDTDTNTKLGVSELFRRYMDFKAKTLTPRTLEKYQAILVRLQERLGDQNAASLDVAGAEAFVEYLRACGNAERTIRDRVTILAACWKWAKQLGHARFETLDPWSAVKGQLKPAPRQAPKPFTREELRKIIEGFRSHPSHDRYADFVEFLFATGLRFAEGAGLRWEHVADDCSYIWVGESITRGVRKATKTNQARYVPLSRSAREILERRRGQIDHELVFPSPRGMAINDRFFSRRAWKTILAQQQVEYRSPYTTRSTFISHCLEAGSSPTVVAQITGHDVSVLYQRYAGNVISKPRIPEITRPDPD